MDILTEQMTDFLAKRKALALFDAEHGLVQELHPAYADAKEMTPEQTAQRETLATASSAARELLSDDERKQVHLSKDVCELMGFHICLKKIKINRFHCVNCCQLYDRDAEKPSVLVHISP